MDKEKALKVLLANACCYTDKIGCSDCPFEPQNGAKDDEDCNQFGNKIVIEAVKALNS